MRRAASEGGQVGEDDAQGEKREAAPRSTPAPLEVRARRLAWPMGESVTAGPRPPQDTRSRTSLKRPARRSPTTTTFGGQHPPPPPAARTLEGAIDAPESGPGAAAAGGAASEEAAPPGARQTQSRPRADSWPEVRAHIALRRASLTGVAHAQGTRLTLEPYDGLTVTAAPLLPASGRGAAGAVCGHEADEESAGEEGDGESVSGESGGEARQPRPRGYWARGGAAFLPFSTLFTKPCRHSPEEALGVANTYQRLSRAEQEVISRTRRVLRQRLSSAHRRRGGADDKVQLSIVVSTPGDSDPSSGGEDGRPPGGALLAPHARQPRDGTHPAGAACMPPRVAMVPRRAARLGLGRKSPGGRRAAGANPFRRARRQEVTTVMSQVSPVPSDSEARAGHGAPQAQGGHGGLLQAILSDAHTYAATAAAEAAARERHAGISARVRRGRR